MESLENERRLLNKKNSICCFFINDYAVTVTMNVTGL